jgi:hypothetical protein
LGAVPAQIPPIFYFFCPFVPAHFFQTWPLFFHFRKEPLVCQAGEEKMAERPTTPGSGFAFRKKSWATPTRKTVKGGSRDKENSDAERESGAAGGAVTNSEFVRRNRRVLKQTKSAPSEAVASAFSEAPELVELQFHKKSKRSPRTIQRRSGSDGCAHAQTPTRGEIEALARANGAATDEEIEAAVSQSESEYEALSRARKEEEPVEPEETSEPLDAAMEDDHFGGMDDDVEAVIPPTESSSSSSPGLAGSKRRSPEKSESTNSPRKRDAQKGRKKRRPRKLMRTVTSESRLSGQQLAARLEPVVQQKLTEVVQQTRSRHPAVADRITEVCSDFLQHVAAERTFQRSNIRPNPRNEKLRNRERSLRVLLGRLDAEATQWKEIQKQFDEQPSIENSASAAANENADVERQEEAPLPVLDTNSQLRQCVLNIDQMLPALQSVQKTERECAEYVSKVSKSVTHEGFAAFARDEDARDIIQQIVMP